MRLKKIVENITPYEVTDAALSKDLDISYLTDNPEEKTTLKFRKPTVAQLYNLNEMVDFLKVQYPTWGSVFLQHVAIILICFDKSCLDEDEQPSSNILLANMISRLSPEQFSRFFIEFQEAFPSAVPTIDQVKEVKND